MSQPAAREAYIVELEAKGDALARERDALSKDYGNLVAEHSREVGALSARVKELEAELAREREEASTYANRLLVEQERRARLEAALNPDPETRREYVIALMENADFDDTEDAIVAMDGLLHAIRKRAGLGEGG